MEIVEKTNYFRKTRQYLEAYSRINAGMKEDNGDIVKQTIRGVADRNICLAYALFHQTCLDFQGARLIDHVKDFCNQIFRREDSLKALIEDFKKLELTEAAEEVADRFDSILHRASKQRSRGEEVKIPEKKI